MQGQMSISRMSLENVNEHRSDATHKLQVLKRRRLKVQYVPMAAGELMVVIIGCQIFAHAQPTSIPYYRRCDHYCKLS